MYFTSLNLAIASKLRIRLLRHGIKAKYSNINDDASIINKFEASLTDDARVVIYDRNMFIIQAAGFRILFWHKISKLSKSAFSTKEFVHHFNGKFQNILLMIRG
jgi:hypothetical protein